MNNDSQYQAPEQEKLPLATLIVAPLKRQCTPEVFEHVISALDFVEDPQSNTVFIKAPNTQIFDIVRQQHLELIKAAMKEHYGMFVPTLKLVIEETNLSDPVPEKTPSSSYQVQTIALNEAFTFNKFVVGSSNELACSAAERMVKDRSPLGGPLLIYGTSGLGKTHLLHAIAHAMQEQTPTLRIALLTANSFVNQMVQIFRHTKSGTLDINKDFKPFFYNLNLLLIDDVQFFAKKERTQSEILDIYQTLIDNGQHIVMTADRHPRNIDGLDERLSTRLTSGLPVVVEPPDFDTRVKILCRKSRLMFNKVLDIECAEIIAKHIQSNVRDLEGALRLVAMYAEIRQVSITPPLIYDALKDIFEQKERQVSIENIQAVVAEYYKIKVSDLRSKNRQQSVALPRQMAIYLSKQLTKNSLVSIGASFGKRDHATILHAIKKIERLRKESIESEGDYKALYRRLTA